MSTVSEIYDNPEREWRRLVKDGYHSLEFLVTMHYIRKHFPPTGKVLDAGAGPGRYSLEFYVKPKACKKQRTTSA